MRSEQLYHNQLNALPHYLKQYDVGPETEKKFHIEKQLDVYQISEKRTLALNFNILIFKLIFPQ